MNNIDSIYKKYGGKPYAEVLEESLRYILDRRDGRIISFKTPWTGLNRAGINGLEWGNLLTVAGRPGCGKTMMVSQIIRESYLMNPGQKFNIIEFQFEMGSKQYGARDFAAQVALDYNVVLSSYQKLDQFTVDQIERYRAENELFFSQGIHRAFLGKPMNHLDMYNCVYDFFNNFPGKDGKPSYDPLIITIDHSWLIKKTASEKEKIATLYNTVEMLMNLKNELPVIIIMLSQLNRSIEEVARKVPGSMANFPTSNDIFGGDALMQGSDMVVVINRPSTLGIHSYGSAKYLAKEESIFMHLLKVRNSANNTPLLFYKAEFNKQRMVETLPIEAVNPNATSDYQPRNLQSVRTISADIGSEL